MHKLIALYHQPDDPAHFERHLVDVHLPIVARFPGLERFRCAFGLEEAGGASPFFAVVECEFADEQTMRAALASPAGQEAAADVPNYASAGVTILTYAVARERLGATADVY